MRWLAVLAVLALLVAGLTGCGDDGDDATKPGELTGTCLSCHQDAEILQATAPTGDGGGGESTGEG
jgi:hypothetical protein